MRIFKKKPASFEHPRAKPQRFPRADTLILINGTWIVWCEDKKIYRSIDYGKNWRTIELPSNINKEICQLRGYNEVWLAVPKGTSACFYRSLNDGLTWEQLPLPIDNYIGIEFDEHCHFFGAISSTKLMKSLTLLENI